MSDRKLTLDRTDEAERRYRDLFDQAPLMYVICRGVKGVPIIEDCNRTWSDTLGYRREEMIGKPLATFYSERSSRDLLEAGGYQRALEGRFGDQERELVTRDGRVLQTLLRAMPDLDSEGRVIGTRAMYVDITARKQAEARLKESEERFRSLFEESRDTVFVSTREGRIVDINPAGVRLFGFDSKEELLAVNTRDVYADPGDRERVVNKMLEQGFVKDAELVLRKRDGSELVVLETATVLSDEATGEVSFRGILRDITERKRLEASLQESRRMEAIGRLSGGVAHDFNNLLTSIKIYASLALNRCVAGSDIYHDLKQVADTADRAADLVNQLLAFSRQQLLQPKVINLNEVVSNLEDILRRSISEDIELTMDLDPDLGMVSADPVQMEQVVMNLTLNARDAVTGGGSITLESDNVKVGRAEALGNSGLEGRCVQLTVADSGCGMDAETVAKIFDPFFTTKEHGKGVGLGLSTVYGIVKQSGGSVRVESKPGRGSTFRVILPAVEEAAADVDADEHPSRVVELTGRERVMVVEDEEILRLVVGRALHEKGYEVVLAADAERALEILEKRDEPIDLLLTDVVLPGMDGKALGEKVERICPEAKVIWMTGYMDRPLTRRSPWEVEQRFLRKPFNLAEMEEAVREVLDGRRRDRKEE